MARVFSLLLLYSHLMIYLPVRPDIAHTELLTMVASSRDDMMSLFGVDSVESVPPYDVVPVHHDRERRDITQTKHYRLSAFNKDFHLQLKPNYDAISSTLEVVRKTSSNRWSKELYTPDGVFYQGHVTSDPNSHVAVREMMGRLLGVILMDGHIYEVRPIPDHVARKVGVKTFAHHVITRRSLKNNFHLDPIKVSLRESRNADENQRTRTKRTAVSAKYYIEAMLTLDKVSCDYYGNHSMDFVLAVANLVNRLFKDKSLTIDITWTVTKIILIQNYEEALDFKKAKIDSAVVYMSKFARWARPNNTANGEVGHYDNGVLLSRSICGTRSCSLDGVAYSGVPCNLNLGYTVNKATGLDAAFSVAHEMGHNFGLNHDADEGCEKGYIMNGGQANGPNAFKWTNCSDQKLINNFKRVTCYKNKPPSMHKLPVIPSGHFYDADKQCQLIHGQDYRVCPLTKNSCLQLFCYKHTGCSSSGAPPVDGTRCGLRKWCIRGQCVDIRDQVPLAIDGGWGEWSSSYSNCSRTCGGGVQYRTRECNKPRPQHHGKLCPGSSVGEWRICNDKPCPTGSPDYRETQCKAKGYSRYYGRDGCTLWCRERNHVTSNGLVSDGTKYFMDNPNVKDICIGGKRQAVGCDNILYSKSIYDRCMKCLGNGGSCVPVSGSYTKDWRRYGAGSADPMFVIPTGATNLFVKENRPTWNLLNMKLFPAKNNSLIFPGRPTNSHRKAAGVKIIYTISNRDLNYAESMEFSGPSTKALVAMFVYVGFQLNVGYKYKFFVPGNASETDFVWKAVRYGTCSQTCARGTIKRKVTCHRQDDQSEVSAIHCNQSSIPPIAISCNEQPCPGRWESQAWGKCTSKCAGGTHIRDVACVQQFTASNYTVVNNNKCNFTTRPNHIKDCNVVDCPPEWVLGEWSPCTRNGSLFTSSRRVLCRTKLANATIVYNNFTVCAYFSNDFVPATVKNCTIPTEIPTKKPTNCTISTEIHSEKTTPRSSTAKILTIIPVRNSSWIYALMSITLVIVILAVVLFVLYRCGRLTCLQKNYRHEPSIHYKTSSQIKKHSMTSIGSSGSAVFIAGASV